MVRKLSVRRWALVLAMAALLAPAAVGAQSIVKVAVLASGTVLADGAPITLAALDERLKGVKATGGAVWYYRENATAEPPPQASEVVQLIVKHQLPVSMSTKADYSDYLDAQGVPRPRPGR